MSNLELTPEQKNLILECRGMTEHSLSQEVLKQINEMNVESNDVLVSSIEELTVGNEKLISQLSILSKMIDNDEVYMLMDYINLLFKYKILTTGKINAIKELIERDNLGIDVGDKLREVIYNEDPDFEWDPLNV